MTHYQEGQQVAIDRGHRTYTLGTVERVTPGGQVLVRVGARLARFNAYGKEIGGSSRPDRLVEATPDILATIRREALVARLKYTKWDSLPLDVLERVAAAIDAE